MSKQAMSDRVELAEALRRILDDSDEETEDHKENVGDVVFQEASPKYASPRNAIRSCLTPINRTLSFVKTGNERVRSSQRSALSPSVHGATRDRRRKARSEDEPSPPKKRRHANHVIILRQPRSKSKQPNSPPTRPTDKIVKSEPQLDSPSAATHNGVGSNRSTKEFTVELETGIAGQSESCAPSTTNLSSNQESSMQTFDLPLQTNSWPNIAVNLSSPPTCRPDIRTPSSSEKRLDAAIDCQIKRNANEEEIESGIPVLDGLDPTASPFGHFLDASQQQQPYPDLSASYNGQAISWPANQEEAYQLAANQQLLQCNGQFFFGDGSQPHLQGDGKLGRWVTRGGSADESLTNITWLKRMSAPDLDPNTLQTAQMMDPRFERPPYSYSTLIQFAISSSRSGKMTLREIYAWIEDTFPYFKTAKAGWRNSIRHNLSLHKIFVREPPMAHGQPAFWTLRPGTVVRLPERRMFVADPENGGTLLQEVAPPPSMLSSLMGGQLQGAPYLMGGAMPQVVMMPGASRGMANSISKENAGCGPKTKKPPLILPRGSQPYALVPVPLLLPPGQNGGQTVGERLPAVPHILSPILMGGVRRFATTCTPQVVGGRKVVPIAPKVRFGDGGGARSSGVNGNSSSSSACNTSSGSDSGVDLSVQNTTPASAPTAQSFGHQSTPNRDLPFKKRGQGRKSLPKIREDIDDADDAEDSFTAFFEQELASPPKGELHAKGLPVVSTPCKNGGLQTWLSPLRGFTPFKNPPLDGDSGIFHELTDDDLPLNAFPTGLTPNFKGSLMRSAARGQRSRVGSLGDLGLPGLTPEKGGHQSSDGIHNQSFGQMFGDLVSLDMEGEGLDVGNLSWTMFSPNKQQST